VSGGIKTWSTLGTVLGTHKTRGNGTRVLRPWGGMSEASKKAGGRPKAPEGQPPMPKLWKDTERLAGVLAYLEASENGANANLENDAKGFYGGQLSFVHTEVSEFKESKHKWGKGHGQYTYSLEESKKRRPHSTATCMVDNFLFTRKLCNNHISPVYYRLHDRAGNAPTGSNRDKLIKEMVKELLPDESDLHGSAGASSASAAVDEEAVEEEAEEVEDQAEGGEQTQGNGRAQSGKQKAVPPQPKKPSGTYTDANVSACFLTWLHLGPLAQQPGHVHPQFSTPVPAGSNEANTRKPAGRKEKREQFFEDLKRAKAKGRQGTGKGGDDSIESLEKRKVAALEKLEKGEAKKRKVTLYNLECKRAEEAYDQRVSRLEKRIGLLKDKKQKSILEVELDELLQQGPTMPEPLAPSEDEKEEEGGEEGGEEGEEELEDEDEVLGGLGAWQ